MMESSRCPLYFHYYTPISNIPFDLVDRRITVFGLCFVAGCELCLCQCFLCLHVPIHPPPDILALIFNWRFVLLCKSIDLRNPTILAFVSLLINFGLARDFWQFELNVLAWLGPPGP